MKQRCVGAYARPTDTCVNCSFDFLISFGQGKDLSLINVIPGEMRIHEISLGKYRGLCRETEHPHFANLN